MPIAMEIAMSSRRSLVIFCIVECLHVCGSRSHSSMDCFSRVAYQFTHLLGFFAHTCYIADLFASWWVWHRSLFLYCWVLCQMIAYKPDHQGSLCDIIKVLCAFNICFIILYLSLCQQMWEVGTKLCALSLLTICWWEACSVVQLLFIFSR